MRVDPSLLMQRTFESHNLTVRFYVHPFQTEMVVRDTHTGELWVKYESVFDIAMRDAGCTPTQRFWDVSMTARRSMYSGENMTLRMRLTEAR